MVVGDITIIYTFLDYDIIKLHNNRSGGGVKNSDLDARLVDLALTCVLTHALVDFLSPVPVNSFPEN